MSDDKEQKDRLDWIEKAAIENLKAHHATADVIAKEASTTLTVLLAGAAGGLAYAGKALDAHSWTWYSFGAAAFTAWMTWLCYRCVKECLMISPIPQIYNEPRNLDAPELTLNELREQEIAGLQNRIDEAAKRNGGLSTKMNNIRKLAVASPLVFAISSLAWAAGYSLGASG
ncbi:TPA: hypothetical protein RJR39_003532 [Burkholderia cenocepacia]|uniref:hypothetical protein n=1 Tax=Burkholderia cenocepacia TaxID=95486 RepID=UPI001BA2B241|nr:hypothetical protein [Burkholderia cenocepacia]MBR8196301.1 hypothetical protein [Burkholderia cenocepacia]HDV6327439.1 hypothetical protein [Burkholderia cenocepacia]HDV6351311.1 hypothetical protein [Burkholderia cenocepacia]